MSDNRERDRGWHEGWNAAAAWLKDRARQTPAMEERYALREAATEIEAGEPAMCAWHRASNPETTDTPERVEARLEALEEKVTDILKALAGLYKALQEMM